MRQIIERFAHTFVINLPERADRMRAVRSELERQGYRLPSPEITIVPGVKFTEADGFPSKGLRGSFTAHLSVIELAREMGLPSALVLEDDLKFLDVPAATIDKIITQIPDAWDVIYFGYNHADVDTLPVGLHAYSGGVIGGHCCAINGTFFDKLILYMRACRGRPPGHPEGGRMGRDGTFNHMQIVHPETRTFLASPKLASQRSSASSISPRWIDLTPLAPLAGIIRRAKDR